NNRCASVVGQALQQGLDRRGEAKAPRFVRVDPAAAVVSDGIGRWRDAHAQWLDIQVEVAEGVAKRRQCLDLAAAQAALAQQGAQGVVLVVVITLRRAPESAPESGWRALLEQYATLRSEERRVGKECRCGRRS